VRGEIQAALLVVEKPATQKLKMFESFLEHIKSSHFGKEGELLLSLNWGLFQRFVAYSSKFG
jgi:hypothetical protein